MRGRVWYVRYQVGGVRHVEAAGPSRKLALDLLAKRRIEAAEGKILPRGRSKIVRWDSLASEWMTSAKARKRSWKRDRTSLRRLTPWLAHRDIRTLTGADVDAYVARRLRQRTRQGPHPSPACINRELALLKSILRAAVDDGKMPTAPRIRLLREPPGRVPRLSADGERDLVALAPFQRVRVLTILLIETGLRLSEALDLRWCDVDLAAALLRVERSKSGHRRDVPMSACAAEVLRWWRTDGDDRDGYVLPTRAGRRWYASTRPFLRAVDAAGLTGLRQHDLRHVCAGRMIERGSDPITVAIQLGHGTPEHPNLQMVARYAHLSPRYRADALRSEVATNTATSPRDDAEKA
jgi:integrase